MSKTKKNSMDILSNQGGLFDPEISEGRLDLSHCLRGALSLALRKCPESRWQVAAKISELAGRTISKEMLDQYTSEKPEYRLPAETLPAFCYVTKTINPFAVLLAPIGCSVSDPSESKFIKLARLKVQETSISQEIVRLEAELGIKNR